MKNDILTSIWTPVKSKRNGVVGYMEMFMTRQGVKVSIPGVSRCIYGRVLYETKATLIDDTEDEE